MSYTVFSDEAGSFGGWENQYYLRSWIFVPDSSMENIRILFDEVKPDSEIKWSQRGSLMSEENLDRLENINFRCFITVTPLGQFYGKKYKILDVLNDSELPQYDLIPTGVIKNKIVESTRQVLFLYYFERLHVKNVLERIRYIDSRKSSENCAEIIIDRPQAAWSLYKGMVSSISEFVDPSMKNPTFNRADSKKYRGVQLADLVASSFHEYLRQKNISKECVCFLRRIVKPKLLNLGNNPNMIFWDANNEHLIKLLKEFKQL